MNKIPYFSIVIPLYNKEKYIKRTLKSVLKQTFTNFEVIIVDDGSTDNSSEIIKSINDSRICLIQQENGGPSKARNRGIQEAKGEFIAFLDADDEWLPGKLEKQYDFHSCNDDVIWSCTSFHVKGGKREEHISYSRTGVINDALDAVMDGMTIQTSAVVIKRSVFENGSLLFNESFKRSEDREVWYKMACLYHSIGYLNTELLIYYVETDGSLNATGLNESDFSFLSLSKRIEKELYTIDPTKKKRFLAYLNHLIKMKMLTFWGWYHSFEEISVHFEGYFDRKTLQILQRFDFLPLLAKKVLVKLYFATIGKF